MSENSKPMPDNVREISSHPMYRNRVLLRKAGVNTQQTSSKRQQPPLTMTTTVTEQEKLQRLCDLTTQALCEIGSEIADVKNTTRGLTIGLASLNNKMEEILKWLKSTASRN